MRGKKITVQVREKVVEAFLQNPSKSIVELAAEFGMNQTTTRHLISKCGRGRLPPGVLSYICPICNNGFSSPFGLAGHRSRGKCCNQKFKSQPTNVVARANGLTADSIITAWLDRYDKMKAEITTLRKRCIELETANVEATRLKNAAQNGLFNRVRESVLNGQPED